MIYGSITNPVTFGSGGGRGYLFSDNGGGGGGAVSMNVTQLRVDGVLSAKGLSVAGGGGSGGSIKITVGILTGNGVIQANGGVSSTCGGGGRMAIYYDQMDAYAGGLECRGGNGGPNYQSGGAGTIYLKRKGDSSSDLIIDNGGAQTGDWSTPLLPQGILHLNSWRISGNARVSTMDGVRVANGNPALFAGLISSNYLQVGGLLVSNTWVFGDVMDLVVSRSNGIVFVTVFCRPQKTYLLLASTNLLDWIPVATNTPTGSRFDYPVPPLASSQHLFYRVAMLEHLYDAMRLSLNPANHRATLTLSNAQPAHTLVLSASDDLRHWTPLATNTPASATHWLYLDTNAPAHPRRFYRAWGQGK